MSPLEFNWNRSATAMTNNAGGVEGQCPRLRSTASAPVANGEITRKTYGRRWESQLAGKRPDANMCRSLRYFPKQSTTKPWWISWWPQKSGSFRSGEVAVDSGLRVQDSGAAGAVMGLDLPVFLYFCDSHLVSFICQRGQRVAREELRHIDGSPGGGGGYRGPVIFSSEWIQYD